MCPTNGTTTKTSAQADVNNCDPWSWSMVHTPALYLVIPEIRAGDLLFFMGAGMTHGADSWRADEDRCAILMNVWGAKMTGGRRPVVGPGQIVKIGVRVHGWNTELRTIIVVVSWTSRQSPPGYALSSPRPDFHSFGDIRSKYLPNQGQF